MAFFPDYPQSYNSKVEPLTGITLDYSIGGDLKGRNLYASSVYSIFVEYEFLTRDEKSFIEDFWRLYKNDKNTITCAVDEHTYEVLFEAEPKFIRPAPDYFHCQIQLQGKRVT